MIGHRPTMLLTGASGVLGRALIEEFATDFDVLCLRHRSRLDDPRVREVAGDLRRHHLGLTGHDWRELACRVDLVVHCGASTNWRAEQDEVAAANVAGTGEVLALAAQAGAVAYHMSTAFVARPAALVERPGSGVAAYLQSKRAAERLVRDSAADAVIMRPSLVIGDSRDGRIAAFQGLHKVMAAIYRGLLPVLPAAPTALIDFVPQDVVAHAVGRLVRLGVRGGEYWMTAGPNALTVDELVGRTLDMAARRGPRPAAPRMVPAETLNRLLLPLLEEVLPASARRVFHTFAELMLLFQADEPIATDLPAIGLGVQIGPDQLRAAFSRSVDYWAAARAAQPAEAPPVAVA
jgi:nucleoside-diphosphate-sugar epimerase